MAVEGAGIAFDGGLQTTLVTLPDQALCHYIRDDELDRLGEMRKDIVVEICLAAVGVFFGSIVPAFDGFKRFGAREHPATSTDLVSMLLFTASLAIFVVTAILWYLRANAHKEMVAEIKDRPKVPLRLISNENPA